MRLLLDENLSPRLVERLGEFFPGSGHVRDVDLVGKPDAAIWDHAAASGFTIISKDDDFHHLSLLRGAPPKVIGLRIVNCTTSRI